MAQIKTVIITDSNGTRIAYKLFLSGRGKRFISHAFGLPPEIITESYDVAEAIRHDVEQCRLLDRNGQDPPRTQTIIVPSAGTNSESDGK